MLKECLQCIPGSRGTWHGPGGTAHGSCECSLKGEKIMSQFYISHACVDGWVVFWFRYSRLGIGGGSGGACITTYGACLLKAYLYRSIELAPICIASSALRITLFQSPSLIRRWNWRKLARSDHEFFMQMFTYKTKQGS